MSVLQWFKEILGSDEDTLKQFVDFYNGLNGTKNFRLAMEAIDGCDGPGDAIITL